MLLVIDIGNTQTVFAAYNGKSQLGQWRMATVVNRSEDEYAVLLADMMALKSMSLDDIEAVVIACVVPGVMYSIKQFVREYIEVPIYVVGESSFNVSMQVQIDRPEDLGADRLINSYTAYQKLQQPLIVVDFGTATTFDVVGEGGVYLGGVIAPGIQLSLRALEQAAAKLPPIAIKRPTQVVGKSTVPAMQSGLYFGYLGLVEGIVTRIKTEQGIPNMPVVVTGGLAALFAEGSSQITHHAEDLMLEGLAQLYESNRKT